MESQENNKKVVVGIFRVSDYKDEPGVFLTLFMQAWYVQPNMVDLVWYIDQVLPGIFMGIADVLVAKTEDGLVVGMAIVGGSSLETVYAISARNPEVRKGLEKACESL